MGHNKQCELSLSPPSRCRCSCGGTSHGRATAGPIEVPSRAGLCVCQWCRAPLLFDRSRGWVHRGGATYVMRCASGCGFATDSLGAQATGRCARCGGLLVDDHCALPVLG